MFDYFLDARRYFPHTTKTKDRRTTARSAEDFYSVRIVFSDVNTKSVTNDPAHRTGNNPEFNSSFYKDVDNADKERKVYSFTNSRVTSYNKITHAHDYTPNDSSHTS